MHDERPLPAWVSALPLLAAAGYLALRWGDIPTRWVSHWGPGGVPNGWSERTTGGVFGPLLIGVVVWTILELVALAANARGRSRPDLRIVVVAQLTLLRLIALGMALVIGALAVMLPLGPHVEPGALVPFVLVAAFGPALVGVVLYARAMARGRRAGVPQLQAYRGVCYHDPDDARLFVPKLLGMGYTINFAHRWAWPVLVLSVGGPIGLAMAFIHYS